MTAPKKTSKQAKESLTYTSLSTSPTMLGITRDSVELRRARRHVLDIAIKFADALTIAELAECGKSMDYALEAMERAAIRYRNAMKAAGRL